MGLYSSSQDWAVKKINILIESVEPIFCVRFKVYLRLSPRSIFILGPILSMISMYLSLSQTKPSSLLYQDYVKKTAKLVPNKLPRIPGKTNPRKNYAKKFKKQFRRYINLSYRTLFAQRSHSILYPKMDSHISKNSIKFSIFVFSYVN